MNDRLIFWPFQYDFQALAAEKAGGKSIEGRGENSGENPPSPPL